MCERAQLLNLTCLVIIGSDVLDHNILRFYFFNGNCNIEYLTY